MATDKGLEGAVKTEVESNYDETIESFDDMSLASELLRGVYAYGFNCPSTFQQRAIMPIIKGHDIIAQAQPGAGKTTTLSISVLQKIDSAVKQCQAIILASTRGHAQQIQNVFVAIGDFMDVECHACFGGTSVHDDIEALQDGPQVVVGTPGRIQNMIQRRFLRTHAMKMFVVDEVDEILSRGFNEQIYDIFQHLPQSTQVIFLSTTMPREVLEVTTKFTHDPTRILVKKDRLVPQSIKHFSIMVEKEEWKLNTLFDLYKSFTTSKTVIFCNTRKKVEWLTDNLKSRNLPFSAMHGDMTAIQRAEIMEQFRSGSTYFLIATELLARGIDVQQIPLVINYDLHANHENYTHRVGRDGHLGRKGIVVNFVTPNDTSLIRKIEHFHIIDIEEITTDDVQRYLLAPEA